MNERELEEIIISGDSVYERKYKNIYATTINKEKNLMKLTFIKKSSLLKYNASCIVSKDKIEIQDIWYKDDKQNICYLERKEVNEIEGYLNKLIILLK